MAKRFTDTDKYKKTFIRSLPCAYKLFWDYLYHDCNHAGIWHKDFEIAQIMIGKDAPIEENMALKLFNEGEERVKILDNGTKWLIVPFAPFQYGPLNPSNRLHASVLSFLDKAFASTLNSPSKGAKDKDKEKEVVVVKSLSLEKGGMGEKENGRSLNPLQKVVRGWKILNNVPEEDKAWDKVHFARNSKPAKELLDLFNGDLSAVMGCMESVFDRLKNKGLDLSLQGVVKNSDVYRQMWLERKARVVI